MGASEAVEPQVPVEEGQDHHTAHGIQALDEEHHPVKEGRHGDAIALALDHLPGELVDDSQTGQEAREERPRQPCHHFFGVHVLDWGMVAACGHVEVVVKVATEGQGRLSGEEEADEAEEEEEEEADGGRCQGRAVYWT